MRKALDSQTKVYNPINERRFSMCKTQPTFPMDGNTAAAYVAYAMSETAFIYYGQAYFNYDSHKENGATTSHLRFGPNEIRSEYMICNEADYIACHHPSYVRKYDMLTPAKDG